MVYKIASLTFVCSASLLAMEKIKVYIPRTKAHDYKYTAHALERMQQRSVTREAIENALARGNRYNTKNNTQLCVDLNSQVGVVLASLDNSIVTVYDNMNKFKLEKWLEKNKPTKAERIAVAKKHAAEVAAHKMKIARQAKKKKLSSIKDDVFKVSGKYLLPID